MLFNKETPDLRWTTCFFLALGIVAGMLSLTGAFDPDSVTPAWFQLTWGVSSILVTYRIITRSNLGLEDLILVVFGPGTLLTWGFHWLSLMIVPIKREDDT